MLVRNEGGTGHGPSFTALPKQACSGESLIIIFGALMMQNGRRSLYHAIKERLLNELSLRLSKVKTEPDVGQARGQPQCRWAMAVPVGPHGGEFM